MKRRARRAAIGAGAIMVILFGSLVLASRRALRDHLEAWRFQLTRNTQTMVPLLEGRTGAAPLVSTLSLEERRTSYRENPSVLTGTAAARRLLLGMIANELRAPVIFDPGEAPSLDGALRTICDIRGHLARSGYHLVEQRVPGRAYVLIPD